ncbi:hypothetical protein FQN50_008583 [Emmonsiellopsis sp. PD_5]|nr:hypothetical protein FQN50_008583 [Emmonsiellopsis sp. PD_5]
MVEVSTSPHTTVPFFHLNDCHARRVIQALRRILATEVAEESFGMLIDGRLTMKALRACRRVRLGEDYDEIAKYTGPSQDTISMFRSLREQLNLSHVLIKASSAERFQRSDILPSSAEFRRGLLDLVVSIVHDLAVSIFEELHQSKYQNTPHQGAEPPLLPDFRHPKYLQSYSYPHGPIELPGAPWIHFPHKGIMRMADNQLDAFTQLAFTTSPASDTAVLNDLLPFRAEPDAQYVDSFDAYKFGLFRNCFEHNPPPNISRFNCTAIGRNVTYLEWVQEYPKKS